MNQVASGSIHFSTYGCIAPVDASICIHVDGSIYIDISDDISYIYRSIETAIECVYV